MSVFSLNSKNLQEAFFIYDGDCGVCQATLDFFDKLNLPEVLIGAKYQSNDDLLYKYGLNAELCDKHAYSVIVSLDGSYQLYKGCDSIFVLMKLQEKSRFWKLLSIVGSLPIINTVAIICYRLFADNRSRISKLLYGDSCKL